MQTVVLDASNNDEKLQTKVFHCLGSWLALDVIPQQHLMASKLLSPVFSAMVITCYIWTLILNPLVPLNTHP